MRKILLLTIVALVLAVPALAQTPTPTVTPTPGGSYGRVAVNTMALGVQTLVAPVAGGNTVIWTAADPVWGSSFSCTGKEILLAQNTHATLAQTVTIKGATDVWGRAADITAYSIAVGGIAYFGPFPPEAFRKSDGKVWVIGSDVTVKFAVIRIP